MSHASMSVFWSGTDDTCCEKLGGGDFTVSIVLNKAKQLLGRIDIYKPFPITISGIKIVVEDSTELAIPQAIKDEVDEKVNSRALVQRNWVWDRESNGHRKSCREAIPFEIDGVVKRYSFVNSCIEIFDEARKEWIKETDYDAKGNDSESRESNYEDDYYANGAVWNGTRVEMKGGETFEPATDTRKYGEVPPGEIFEVCQGERMKMCANCAYLKECMEYVGEIVRG